MDNNCIEDQLSSALEDPEVIQADSNEVESSASSVDRFKPFNEHGMIRLEEGNMERDNIVRGVRGRLERVADVMNVLAVHKNMYSSLRGRARVGTFRIYAEAVAKKCGGDANVKDAWYGASKDEICSIISNGFICKNDGIQGIQLSPVHYPFQRIISAVEDENGMKHILLCRVILGNMKIVQPGEEEFRPCFESFDSGVDNPVEPRRYIIWSAYMNSHIYPNYVISFRLSGNTTMKNFPQSPHMRMTALLNVLSKYLHPSQMDNIGRYHKSFLANEISRDQLVRHIRLIAGDNLLKTVITSINLATSGNSQRSNNKRSEKLSVDMKSI